MNYTDYRKGRSIGTSATSDIKCMKALKVEE